MCFAFSYLECKHRKVLVIGFPFWSKTSVGFSLGKWIQITSKTEGLCSHLSISTYFLTVERLTRPFLLCFSFLICWKERGFFSLPLEMIRWDKWFRREKNYICVINCLVVFCAAMLQSHYGDVITIKTSRRYILVWIAAVIICYRK